MENMQVVLDYFSEYGLIFLFVIVFLEYLNLPGLPAGIIMPAAGLLVAANDVSFLTALVLSVLAGLLGSYALYLVGYFLGHPVLEWFYHRFEQMRPAIERAVRYTEAYGDKGVFVARLIPVARTLVSLTVGTVRMNLLTFTIYSTFGILIWNFVFIYAGYAFGYLFLK